MQLHEFTSPHGRHEVNHRSAEISDCGKFRYVLRREWTGMPLVSDERYVCWLMLNPSTADASLDDPTIVRCIKFAARWGFTGMFVVNLFPFRSSSPKECQAWLRSDPELVDEAMRHNWIRLQEYASMAALPVVAFGSNVLAHGLAQTGLSKFHWGAGSDYDMRCLGISTKGYPLHPMARGKLRVPDDTVPKPWSPRLIEGWRR